LNETLSDLGDTEGLLLQQSAAMAGTMQSNIQNLQTAFNRFADSNLTKPLEKLTELLNKLSEDPERLQKVFKGIAVGIGAIAAVKGIAGISRLVGSLLQLKNRNIDIGGALSMSTAMPVYVTNWGGGGGIPGIGSGGPFQIPGVGQPNNSSGIPTSKPGDSSLVKGGLLVSSMLFVADKGIKLAHTARDELAKVDAPIPGMANYYNLNPRVRKHLWEEYTAKHGVTQIDIMQDELVRSSTNNHPEWAQSIVNLFKFKPNPSGEGIGAATAADNGTEEGQSNRRGPVRPGYRTSAARRQQLPTSDEGIGAATVANDGTKKRPGYRTSAARRQQIPSSSLPPQITQASPGITPQTVELGDATIGIDLRLTEDKAMVTAAVTTNTMHAKFDTGSWALRRRSGV
jgi:hypothetical protein